MHLGPLLCASCWWVDAMFGIVNSWSPRSVLMGFCAMCMPVLVIYEVNVSVGRTQWKLIYRCLFGDCRARLAWQPVNLFDTCRSRDVPPRDIKSSFMTPHVNLLKVLLCRK